MVTGKSFAK